MSEIDNFYSTKYDEFISRGLVGLVARFTHKSLERNILRISHNKKEDVLEIGAGNGQHIRYVSENFNTYTMTDIRPEMLPKQVGQGIKIISSSINAESLPFQDDSFDRLVATCLIAHLAHPENALKEWSRVVKKGGLITIYVPCEPGMLLRFSQLFITSRKKKRLGIQNPSLAHYKDHLQHYPALKTFIISQFPVYKKRMYPIPFFSWNFNLWSVFHIQN